MMKNFSISLLVIFLVLSAYAGEKSAYAAIEDDAHPAGTAAGFRAPAVSEKIEYYDIAGTNENELVDQLREKGCRTSDGRTYDSITRWHITWDYGYDRTEQGCVADDFKASVDITCRFPRWVQTDAAPATLTERWGRYIMNLAEHEQGHRDIAVDTVMILSQDIAELPPFPECKDVDRAIQSIIRERTAKLNEISWSYDDTTDHGTTQGAAFP